MTIDTLITIKALLEQEEYSKRRAWQIASHEYQAAKEDDDSTAGHVHDLKRISENLCADHSKAVQALQDFLATDWK